MKSRLRESLHSALLVLSGMVAGLGVVAVLDMTAGGFPALFGAGVTSRCEVAPDTAQLAAELRSLEQQRQLDEATYAEIERRLQLQSRELTELRTELAFFRQLTLDQGASAGLAVQGLQLTPGRVAGEVHYRVLLSRLGETSGEARGKLKLWIEGAPGTRALGRQQLGAGAEAAFRLRHLARVEGDLKLPDAFEPTAIRVELDAGAGGKQTRRFPWRLEGAG